MNHSTERHAVITDTATLKEICAHLSQADYITVDTEFLREKTYYPQLCLVQLAGPDAAVAVDPLAAGMDLAPLFDLLANPHVLKVFHACRQDMEIFYQLMQGMLPAPVFDTQIAAMVCGYGESVGYEPLVSKLVGAAVDKSSRFTDWSRRPLTPQQLSYALSDVTHLRGVYEKLVAQIREAQRVDWTQEEMQDLLNPAKYETNPDEAWMRLRYRIKTPKFLAALREVAKWRELEAQKSNVPRARIVKDETLLDIAASMPKDEDDLARIRGLGGGLGVRRSKALLAVIEAARAMPASEFPRLPHRRVLPKHSEGVVELLRVLLKIQCDKEDVAQKLVASKDDLENFMLGDEVPFSSGWRYTLFGQYARKLAEGKLALLKGARGIEVREV